MAEKASKSLPKRTSRPHHKEYRAKCWSAQRKAKERRIVIMNGREKANKAEVNAHPETVRILEMTNAHSWRHKCPSKQVRAIERYEDGKKTAWEAAQKRQRKGQNASEVLEAAE